MTAPLRSTPGPRVIQRYGFTLVETLLVVVVMGLIMALSFPRVQGALARQSVHGSRNKLVGLYSQARLLAMQQGRTTEVRQNGSQVVIVATPRLVALAGSPYDTVASVYDAATEFGAAVAMTPTTIIINPRGYGTAQTTLITSKSGYADTVVISQFGRILK